MTIRFYRSSVETCFHFKLNKTYFYPNPSGCIISKGELGMEEALLRIRKICRIKLENYVILKHLNTLAFSFSSSRFEGQGISNFRFFYG